MTENETPPEELPISLDETLRSLAKTLDDVSKVLDKERKGRRIGMIAVTVGLVMTALASGLGWLTLRDAQSQVSGDRCRQINETRVDTRQAFASAFDEALSQIGEESPQTRQILQDMDARVAEDLAPQDCES